MWRACAVPSSRLGCLEPVIAPFQECGVRSCQRLVRHPQGSPIEALETCQERSVVCVKDVAGNMDPQVRVHSDQVGIECRVVERRHADSVGGRMPVRRLRPP